MTSLEALPTELLSQCFSYLNPRLDIGPLRLVSRKCNEISSEYAVLNTTFTLTSKSLTHLEELADHAIFSKTVTCVSFDLAYYDKLLVDDFVFYGKHCVDTLSQAVKRLNRPRHSVPAREISEVFKISDIWRDITIGEAAPGESSEAEKLLVEAHAEYIQRFKDQEESKAGGAHITRIAAAFKRFANLKRIILHDYDSSRTRREFFCTIERFSDEDLIQTCLDRSEWGGSFVTALVTSPPADFIPQLFEALSHTNIRPQEFEIQIQTPFNLSCMQFSPDQLTIIRSYLSHAKRVKCTFQWTCNRYKSAEPNNGRTKEQVLALGSFTKALFSSPLLQKMNLSFFDYPVHFEVPTISLSDLLVLPFPSPSIQSIQFSSIPVYMYEISLLTSYFKDTLREFITWGLYLLDGSWITALDTLKGLHKLKRCKFKYPRGGDLFLDFDDAHILEAEVKDFLLGFEEENPVVSWPVHPDEDKKEWAKSRQQRRQERERLRIQE